MNLRRAKATLSAEAFSEEGQRVKIALKNGDFLIASKMRSIHFSNFHSLTPNMIHRAPFCATFLRKKVAKRMFNIAKKRLLHILHPEPVQIAIFIYGNRFFVADVDLGLGLFVEIDQDSASRGLYVDKDDMMLG